MKRKSDERRQQEYNIDRISKPLLVFRIVRPSRIQHTPVVSLLDFYRDVVAVRIAVVEQQFTRPQPARIEIRQIAARTLMLLRVGSFIRNEHALYIEPHAARAK